MFSTSCPGPSILPRQVDDHDELVPEVRNLPARVQDHACTTGRLPEQFGPQQAVDAPTAGGTAPPCPAKPASDGPRTARAAVRQAGTSPEKVRAETLSVTALPQPRQRTGPSVTMPDDCAVSD